MSQLTWLFSVFSLNNKHLTQKQFVRTIWFDEGEYEKNIHSNWIVYIPSQEFAFLFTYK